MLYADYRFFYKKRQTDLYPIRGCGGGAECLYHFEHGIILGGAGLKINRNISRICV
jgi:hypothetical protein